MSDSITLEQIAAEIRRLEKANKGPSGGMTCEEVRSALHISVGRARKILKMAIALGMMATGKETREDMTGVSRLCPVYIPIARRKK